MPSTPPVPFDRSYWADPGRLLAGAYPGAPQPEEAARKLRRLVAAGIGTIVDLTEDRDELEPYAHLLDSAALVDHLGLPIRDVSIPTKDRMDEIQASIDASLERERPVYVHCWGGRGRTGMVVGIYLVRRGLATPEDFVDRIAALRANDPGGGGSPETREQIAFVRQHLTQLRA